MWNTIYCKLCSLLFFANKHHSPHHTFNPLFTASRWDWQPHCYVGAKYFDCVVQVPRWRRNPWCCAALHSSANNLHVSFISYWFDNLGFLLRENLLLCASHLPLGVPNGCVNYTQQVDFLAALPGRSRYAARGVSHFQSLYLIFVLLYFTLFTALFAFLYQNTKKISYLLYFIYCLVCVLNIKNTKN